MQAIFVEYTLDYFCFIFFVIKNQSNIVSYKDTFRVTILLLGNPSGSSTAELQAQTGKSAQQMFGF